MKLSASEEETARLIMMEFRDRGDRSIIHFATSLRAEVGRQIPTLDVSKVWQKYMGIDRLRPTHDLDTGERL